MEKRDMIVIVVAILIVLIMAMYIKPLVTGKEAKLIPDEITGLFTQKNDSDLSENTTFFPNQSENQSDNQFNNSFSIKNNTTENIIENTSIKNVNKQGDLPIWNGSSLNIKTTIVTPEKTPIRKYPIDDPNLRYSFKESNNLTTYAIINGNRSQITDPIYVPDKYWELWYTVELNEDLQNPQFSEEFLSEDEDDSVATLSAVNPSFTISVIDFDTGFIIRNITPTGGLDPKTWQGLFGRSDDEEIPFKETYGSSKSLEETLKTEAGDEIEINWDPRPWKEKFFDGAKWYKLIVMSRFINTYSIEIKVSNRTATMDTPIPIPTGDITKNLSTPLPITKPNESPSSPTYDDLIRTTNYKGKLVEYEGKIVRVEDNIYILKPNNWDLSNQENLVLDNIDLITRDGLTVELLLKDDKILFTGIVTGGVKKYVEPNQNEISLPIIDVKEVKIV